MNRIDGNGHSPIHRACIRYGNDGALAILLAKGGDPELLDKDQRTALDLAKKGHNRYEIEVLENYFREKNQHQSEVDDN